MSKHDRLQFIARLATKPARVLSRLDGFSPEQAKRVLRRVCPKLHLNRA
jgi:hypothetical protein